VIIGIDASRAMLAGATGTEHYSWQIISALVRQLYQLTMHNDDIRLRLYTRWGEDQIQAFYSKNDRLVEITPIATKRLWTHIGLSRELLRNAPDAMFIPAHVLPIACFKNIKKQLQPNVSVRTVVTVHDIGYRRFPSAHPFIQRMYLELSTAFSVRFATHLVTVSHTTQADMMRFYGVPANKISVIYPGHSQLALVNDAQIHHILSSYGLEGTNYVLYVGTLQPRKNIRRLIEAWVRVIRQSAFTGSQSLPTLVIAGKKGWGGVDAEMIARELNMTEHVKVLGYVNDETKSALFRCASAFAFPSLYEGFGFPVLEAQSCAVPVVCSNSSSLPEVAGDGAIFVNPLSADEIAQGLIKALCDDTERHRAIALGKQNIERFSWQTSALQVLNVLVGR
jgi:glycosyltransferase involved in cell wall biosynthesis